MESTGNKPKLELPLTEDVKKDILFGYVGEMIVKYTNVVLSGEKKAQCESHHNSVHEYAQEFLSLALLAIRVMAYVSSGIGGFCC